MHCLTNWWLLRVESSRFERLQLLLPLHQTSGVKLAVTTYTSRVVVAVVSPPSLSLSLCCFYPCFSCCSLEQSNKWPLQHLQAKQRRQSIMDLIFRFIFKFAATTTTTRSTCMLNANFYNYNSLRIHEDFYETIIEEPRQVAVIRCSQ